MEKKESSKTTKKKSASKDPDNKKTKTKKDFLVVGLGASAGGVKALQEFFATMPPNSGMAFVVILHLSPEHESSLPQIIQAQTQMNVTQVTKTIKVEPNNVYVIPPNVQLEMVDGVIRPAKANRPHGHRVAIDVFFRTLAEAYEKNAVCVVLSGTGSDGTLGLKRVKESNGFAIVQLPEDAEYDSMPRSAINTQLADWVLPVHRMPEKLIHFKESSERLHLTNGADAKQIAEEINADESLREILTILRVRTGHDFSSYKTPTLVRRIARHLQIHELEDIPTYLDLLRKEPNEVQSLLKNLLINVTNFFRDREAFESLRRTVVPKIFDGKNGKETLRVWSCGCASGEEAYSLAMILQEYADTLPDPPKIQVFASDVDDEALAEAREHRYPEAIEADISPERLKKFFIKEGAFYRVRKELRETVLFAPHNVLRDPPFSRLDLIVCRNVLIYLNRLAQEKVLEIFHFALVSHGFLFLGNSESADGTGHLFAALDKKQKIYSRRYSATHVYLPSMPDAGRWEVPITGERTKETHERRIALSDIHYKLLENYAPSSVLVNQDFDIVYLSGTAGKFMRFTGGEPSHNILKAVNPDLLPDLRAALFTAQRTRTFSEFPNVRVNIDGETHVVNIVVRTVDVSDELADYLLVIFEERVSPKVMEEAERLENISDRDEAMETIVRRLEEDLQRTKEHLRFTLEQHDTTVEELKAANEELQAINEELRSAGEELETSKEELQSVNEELVTVNHEYKEKIEEAARFNSDLQNLMESTDIASIFLDKKLQIKRYTPPIEELFNITQHDIGRPLEHFTHHLDFDKMSKEAARVLRTLKSSERETADEEGNTYLARFLPYRTIDDRIDGVVLNFIDITDRQQAEQAVRESEAAFRVISEAAPALVWVCSPTGANIYFNQQWFDYTGQTEKTAEGTGWTTTMHPDDAAAILPYWERCQQTGEVYEGEVRYRRRDGEYRWHHFRALPRRNEAGEIEAWYGVSVDVHDSKLAETIIRESEKHLRAFLEASSDAVYSMNHDWSEMRFLSGKDFLPATDHPDEDWLEKYIPPEDRQAVLATIRKAISARSVFEFEHRVVRADGTIGWTFSRAIPILDTSGVIVEWFGAASDVTTRRETSEALTESEEKYRSLFNSIDEGFCTIEVVFNRRGKAVDYRFLECNAAFERQTGLGNPVGRLTSEVTPNLEDFWYETYGRIVKTGTPERFEHEAALDPPRIFDVYAFRTGEPDENRVAVIFSDITRRKTNEEAVRKSEEQLNLILESTSDYAIVAFDLDGIVTRWNPGAAKIFGYAENEIVGRDGRVLFTPEDRAAGIPEKEMQTALKKGRAEDERWHLRKDGSRFFASGVMQPLKDGKNEGFVKIARDQTERLEAENNLREKETLRRLVAGQENERRRIARDIHDHFGQQISTLRLQLDAARQKSGDDELSAEINKMQKTAAALDADVDFIAWELRPVALDDLGLIATLNNFVREWSHHTRVEAEFHFAGLSKWEFDFETATNLYRIAQEALNNIYKHAKAKKVSVLLERRRDRIVLIIEDDGAGFDTENKKNRNKGIGLIGMAERAKILGGDFEIESQKNAGTTVFARVPLENKKQSE